MPDGVTGIFH